MSVYVQAIQVVNPPTAEALGRWLDFYGAELSPRMEAHGFEFLGAWRRQSARPNELLVLTRFDGLGAYEQASALLFQDRELGRSLNVLLRDIVFEEEITFGQPLPYAGPERLQAALALGAPAARLWFHAVTPVRFGTQRESFRALAESAALLEASGELSLVAAYEAVSGLRGLVNEFWAGPANSSPAALAATLSAAPGAGLPAREVLALEPAAFSPLR
jgi:hypothetical protein